MPSPPTAPALPAIPVTQGPRHHFFGYYDKSPWDASGRWLLAMESGFMDRPPGADDVLTIGLVDTRDGCAWRPLAETRAWNWQQGCMLQWLDGGRGGEIIFNDRRDGRLVARILHTGTGAERQLERPVYAVNAAGTRAVSLNFARLHHQRPGYGYAGVADPWRAEPAPADDGIFALDLATGASRLILSTAGAAAFRPRREFAGRMHRFNHAQFSADGDRFACLHRYKLPTDEVGETRLLTLNLDGSDLRCLADHGLVSHYDWRGAEGIVAWAHQFGRGDHFYYIRDREPAEAVQVGEGIMPTDGHCSFSPDGRWLLNDTYPDATRHRTLMLYEWATGRRVDVGRFHAPAMDWQIRCDLHPRWSRDGRQVCIDSVHEGTRQMYVIDVAAVTGGA